MVVSCVVEMNGWSVVNAAAALQYHYNFTIVLLLHNSEDIATNAVVSALMLLGGCPAVKCQPDPCWAEWQFTQEDSSQCLTLQLVFCMH